MKADFKAKWLDALRSDKYDQTTGKLRVNVNGTDDCESDVGFCCLGVLLDVAGPGEWEYEQYTYDLDGSEITDGTSTSLLGHYESTTIELDAEFDYLTRSYFELSETDTLQLIEMNDSLGKSFKQIADWIEKEL